MRVIEAAQRIASAGVIQPVFLTGHSETLGGIKIFDKDNNRMYWTELIHEAMKANLSGGGTLFDMNDQCHALDIGALLLHFGYVDAAVAGAISNSSQVIKSGIKHVGVTKERTVSGFFLMVLNEMILAFADCAVIPEPTPEQLSQIAIHTADNFILITGKVPSVAFLSFSTLGSASHAKVSNIREAVTIAKAKRPDLEFDGELQFDAAFVPSVARRKAPNSVVAGHANVYIFPDLQSANIAYKVAERVGGARAIGPILQGLRKPWMDLSRGCSVDDIVDIVNISACVCD